MATYCTMILAIAVCLCIVKGEKNHDLSNFITNYVEDNERNGDLKRSASTYNSGWADHFVNNGYGVTGHGILDNNYNAHYDNYRAHNRYEPISGHGYKGRYSGYEGKSADYLHKNTLEYKLPESNVAYLAHSGNGGYGGYGGNGGLNSYLGYNNPLYNGANHLGYGYYNEPNYRGIYNNGITPSLVTGYRGYSRK